MANTLTINTKLLPFLVNVNDRFINDGTRLIWVNPNGYSVSLNSGSTWTAYSIVDVDYQFRMSSFVNVGNPVWLFGDTLYILGTQDIPGKLFIVNLLNNTFTKLQTRMDNLYGDASPIELYELNAGVLYGLFASNYVTSSGLRTIYATMSAAGYVTFQSYAIDPSQQSNLYNVQISNLVDGEKISYSTYSIGGSYYHLNRYTSQINKSSTLATLPYASNTRKFLATKNYVFDAGVPSYSTDGLTFNTIPNWNTYNHVICSDMVFGYYYSSGYKWEVLNPDFSLSSVDVVVIGDATIDDIQSSGPLHANIVNGQSIAIYPKFMSSTQSYLTTFSFSSGPVPLPTSKIMTPILNHSRWLALK